MLRSNVSIVMLGINFDIKVKPGKLTLIERNILRKWQREHGAVWYTHSQGKLTMVKWKPNKEKLCSIY